MENTTFFPFPNALIKQPEHVFWKELEWKKNKKSLRKAEQNQNEIYKRYAVSEKA